VLIKDLVEAASEQAAPGGFNLGGLEQLLQGNNLEGLMKMLGE
jgi:hypothetical protein